MSVLRGLVAGILDLIDGLSRLMAWLSGLTFLLLSFYITVDTLGRSFGGPYSGFTDDISAFAMAAAGTWASAYALQVGGHVRIDVLSSRLPPRAAHLLQAGALALLVLPALLVVDAAAWQRTLRAVQRHEIDLGMAWQVPVWPAYGLIATGLGLLALQVAVEAGRHVRATRAG